MYIFLIATIASISLLIYNDFDSTSQIFTIIIYWVATSIVLMIVQDNTKHSKQEKEVIFIDGPGYVVDSASFGGSIISLIIWGFIGYMILPLTQDLNNQAIINILKQPASILSVSIVSVLFLLFAFLIIKKGKKKKHKTQYPINKV